MSAVTRYVEETLNKERGLSVKPEPGMSLVDSGMLDSLSIVTFVGRLESGFGISISMADMTLENFDTIERIAAMVIAKQLAG
ncbi:MAG TPA: acyl carrier protein [Vicinamibacterales bacterium]|nr:acyl carrier protein [Vicinamibacterales bacterium]